MLFLRVVIGCHIGRGRKNGVSQTRVFGGEGRERLMTNISFFLEYCKKRELNCVVRVRILAVATGFPSCRFAGSCYVKSLNTK
jgi:hypothetical protein